jgi:O-antigen/teichoic acid export membrane protein
VLCSLGLLATCVQRLPGLVAEGRAGEAGRLVRTAVIVYLLGAAAVISVVCLFAETISRQVLKTPATAPQVRVAAIAALCFGLYEASQLLLSSMQRFGRLGTYNIAAAIAQRTLSLALFLRFGMEGFLLGFAAGSLIGAAMGSTVFGRMLGREARGGQGGAGEGPVAWIRYSMPFYLDGFLRYLYMHADQVLVAVFLDPVDLSIYFLAKRFIQYCEVLVSSLVTPLGTRVSELRSGDPAGVARLYGLSLRLFVLLFIPLAVLLACLSPFLILVVGGQRYAAGALPLGLLFLSLPFFSIFSHLATFVWVLGVPLDRVRNNMVSMAAQAAAIVVLMPWLRLPGLALARSAGFAAAMVVAGRMARHRLPVAPPGGLQAGRCLLPTAAMASIILIPHLLIGDARLLPLYALPAVTACLAGYMMVVLTARDRNEIASRIPGRGRMARAARGLLSPGAAGGATPI